MTQDPNIISQGKKWLKAKTAAHWAVDQACPQPGFAYPARYKNSRHLILFYFSFFLPFPFSPPLPSLSLSLPPSFSFFHFFPSKELWQHWNGSSSWLSMSPLSCVIQLITASTTLLSLGGCLTLLHDPPASLRWLPLGHLPTSGVISNTRSLRIWSFFFSHIRGLWSKRIRNHGKQPVRLNKRVQFFPTQSGPPKCHEAF